MWKVKQQKIDRLAWRPCKSGALRDRWSSGPLAGSDRKGARNAVCVLFAVRAAFLPPGERRPLLALYNCELSYLMLPSGS